MTEVHIQTGVIWHPSSVSVSSEPLAAYPYLRHLSTTRDFSAPGTPRLQELLRVRQHLDAPASFLCYGEQRHSDNVGSVTADIVHDNASTGYWRFPETDAIICPLRNVTIAIQTADCAPVFLYDPNQEVIALIHAGWKGTLHRIATKTIQKMRESGCSPKDLVAWVGPMAGGCCYEVSEELIFQFRDEFSVFPPESISRGRYLDLVELNCLQLEQAGLVPKNVHRSNLCTIHQHEHFHSYRANSGTNGRIISAMVMLEKN